MDIKIGDKLLEKKETHRWGVNRFDEVTVLGETSRSWIVGVDLNSKWNNFKVPKHAPFSTGKIYTPRMVEEFEFITNHKYKILQTAERISDYETLKKLAELVGYAA